MNYPFCKVSQYIGSFLVLEWEHDSVADILPVKYMKRYYSSKTIIFSFLSFSFFYFQKAKCNMSIKDSLYHCLLCHFEYSLKIQRYNTIICKTEVFNISVSSVVGIIEIIKIKITINWNNYNNNNNEILCTKGFYNHYFYWSV